MSRLGYCGAQEVVGVTGSEGRATLFLVGTVAASPPSKSLLFPLPGALPVKSRREFSSRLLRELLKQYFGFASFRPLQEEIIQDALAGKDVFAVLPTGGGKSLCFQLPALTRPGLTVVVSPLIALMKDQVDALQAAACRPRFSIRPSLPVNHVRAARPCTTASFRLLYVAPERLMLSGFVEDLQRWNVNLIAIDEAHCISEWGHDFRPEYRQISSLREKFPAVPLMALTATATERVRGDIVQQLHLREPRCYVASFNRPNLPIVFPPRPERTGKSSTSCGHGLARAASFIARRAKRRKPSRATQRGRCQSPCRITRD